MSLRILFAIHSIRDPATAVFMNVLRRAEALRAQGHEVDIVAPADVGIRVMTGIWPLLYGAALARRGRLASYDLVVFHSHCGWAFSLLRPFVPAWRRATIVTTFHGLEPLYHEAEQRELARVGRRYGTLFRLLHTRVLAFLTRLSCRRSEAVFVLNAAERAYLVQQGWCPARRVAVVANGVERELFRTRRHQGCATTLLFVGQWLPRKGTRYLAEAFEFAARRDPALRLVCAGTGVEPSVVLADFASEVRDRVQVHRRVDRQALGDLLQHADVFVFPSLFEGSSGALLEAMASSLAVVATPAGAAADILRDGQNALVVPYADPSALRIALERVTADGDLRDRLARAAYDAALSSEWTRANSEYCAYLMGAVDERVSSRRSAA